jgi:head-tail adaptor
MISHLLKDNVTVYTITESISSETGENIKTESTGDVIKARISPLSDRESYFAQKNNRTISHRMYCDYSTLCDSISRVSFGTSTYEVVGGPSNPSMWNKFLEIDLQVVS